MAAIPVVDFSPLSLSIPDYVRLNEHEVRKTADELMSAFTSTGFVYLSNTGFSQQLVYAKCYVQQSRSLLCRSNY